MKVALEKGNGRHHGSVVHHSPVFQLAMPLAKTSLELDDGVNPVPKVGHPGHHPRLVPLGAADAPGDDAGEVVPAVLPRHGHGPAGVPLQTREVETLRELRRDAWRSRLGYCHHAKLQVLGRFLQE